MHKFLIGAISVFIVAGIFFLSIVGYLISTLNFETRLSNRIETKMLDNQSEHDNMWKKIASVAEVTDKQREALASIFVEHANARNNNFQNSLTAWITESVPNVDTATFNNLQNIITSSRDAWTQRQKELLDLSRAHNDLLEQFPSGIILSIFGREKVTITIITSSKTENVFKTGKDDDISVFNK